MIVYDSRNKPVSLARKIGVGGQGDVYEVSGRPYLVAKIYRKNLAGYEEKLAYMIDNPPSGRVSASGHVTLAWPSDLLYDATRRSKFIGFLMPYIKGSCPLLQVFSPRLRSKTLPGFDRRYLFRTARNLASVLSTLHDKGYVVGDLNESNVMVTPSALVTFIDCDSFQVREVREGQIITYPCTVGKPQYTAPESQGMTFSTKERQREEDLFALGVLIFQLLMEGRLPFSGTWTGSGDPPAIEEKIRLGCFPYADKPTCPILPPPNAPALKTLPPPAAQLVRRCFIDGHKDRMLRPTAHVWNDVLLQAERTPTQPRTGHGGLPSLPQTAQAQLPFAASAISSPIPSPSLPGSSPTAGVGGRTPIISRTAARAGSALGRAYRRLSRISWFDWWALFGAALFFYAKFLYHAVTRVTTIGSSGPVGTQLYGDGWLSSGIAWNVLEVVLLTVTVGTAVIRLRAPHHRRHLPPVAIYTSVGAGLVVTTLLAFLELEDHLRAFVVTPREGFFAMLGTGYFVFTAGAFQFPGSRRFAWRRQAAQMALIVAGLPAVIGASVFATESNNVPPLGVTTVREAAAASTQPPLASTLVGVPNPPLAQQNAVPQPSASCSQATVTAGATKSADSAPSRPPPLLPGSQVASVADLRVRFFAPPWWKVQPDRVTDKEYAFTSVPSADYSRLLILRVPGLADSETAGIWLLEASAYMSETIKTDIVLTRAPRGQTVAGYNGSMGQFHYNETNGIQIDATLWVGQVGCDRVLLYFLAVPSGDRLQDQVVSQVFATIDFNPK